MKISLIGMSNSGKTHWSTKLSQELEKIGFVRFCCDESIKAKLDKEMTKLGFSGIHALAKWMGQPYEKRYKVTSYRYQQFEKEVVEEFLNKVKHMPPSQNVVIDTTGSVIYLGDTIMNRLKKLTTIVYLDTPDSVQKQMYENYIKNPKPVIWGDSFKQKRGESNLETLSRCYPKLLAFRTKRYKKFADITFDYHLVRRPNFSVEEFLNNISPN